MAISEPRRKIILDWLRKTVKPPSPSLNTSKKVKSIIAQLGEGARILDLGCGKRKLADYVIRADVNPKVKPDVVCDAHKLPFKTNYFDAIICTALLEHVSDPQKVVLEIYRTLKPNGVVYVEIPFLQGYHSDPYDFQRFTIMGLEKLFEAFKKTEVGVCVGPSSALAWMLGKYPSLLVNNKLFAQALEFLFRWLSFPIKYLDLIAARKKRAHTLAAGLYFYGAKKGYNGDITNEK